MPEFDTTAAAALALASVQPAFFGFLDLDGDPIRATTAGYDVTFPPETADPDLAGFTFSAIDPRMVQVGDLEQGEAGSQPLTVTLSGTKLDAELVETLQDRSRWMGRVARFWRLERNAAGAAVGALTHYHTGYMSTPEFDPSAETPVIRLRIEGYLAAITAQPSNRTYLSQAEYDPADTSAAATIGAANGAKAGPGASTSLGVGTGGNGGVGGGGGGRSFDTQLQ